MAPLSVQSTTEPAHVSVQAAAVKLLDEAIRLDPDNRWFYVNKAGAQAELRDLSPPELTRKT